MNETTLYYFFSTLAQTYGAIVGLIGMLTVYKLQKLEDSAKAYIDEYQSQLTPVRQKKRILINNPFSAATIWVDRFEKEPEIFSDKDDNLIEKIRGIAVTIKAVVDGTKIHFAYFLISNVVIIFFSLIFLPFCERLQNSGWKYFWVVILLILVVVSLYSTVRLCLVMVRIPFTDVWKRTWGNIKDQLAKWEKVIMEYL